MILNCATNTKFSNFILCGKTIGLFCLEVKLCQQKWKPPWKIGTVLNVDSGQNCKAKTSLNWPFNRICDTFSRLVMILCSLDLFLY